MASKFLRRQKWWIKLRHPLTGESIRESLETGEPGKASPFTLQAGRRYALHVEVRRAADVVDLHFRIDGQLVGQFHGAKDRLSVSTRWWTGPNRTALMLGANKPGTFHSLRVKALDEAPVAADASESK